MNKNIKIEVVKSVFKATYIISLIAVVTEINRFQFVFAR